MDPKKNFKRSEQEATNRLHRKTSNAYNIHNIFLMLSGEYQLLVCYHWSDPPRKGFLCHFIKTTCFFLLHFFGAPKSILYFTSTVSGCDGGNRTRNIAVHKDDLLPFILRSLDFLGCSGRKVAAVRIKVVLPSIRGLIVLIFPDHNLPYVSPVPLLLVRYVTIILSKKSSWPRCRD